MKKKVTDQDIISALNEIIRETNKPQKVELGIKDFEKLLKEANTKKKQISKYVKEAEETENSFIKLQKKLKKLKQKKAELKSENGDINEQNMKELDKLSKQAKELGIKDTDTPHYKIYGKTFDIISQNRKDLDKGDNVYKYTM